jgi:ribosomal protein L7/L12
MPTLKIIGYETGLNKFEMVRILREALELDEKESNKMTDALMNGNVISLKFDDSEFAESLAEELAEVGAKVKIDADTAE